jgi:monofunctional glycosyltransferase
MNFRGPLPGGDPYPDDPTVRTAAPRTVTFAPTGPVEPYESPRAANPGKVTPRRSRLRRAVKAGVIVAALVVTGMIGVIAAYRFVAPPTSTYMLAQRLSGQEIRQTWVPLAQIAPNLVRAVIMSEDAGFCRHSGVDWRELLEAVETAKDGIARGGSTISMQVAKNLFLWPSKSYLRKTIEIPLTLSMELLWSKPRMLEIYLNIVEWGPGIFGAEAAAQYHFNKPASRLTEPEAALLAVALPAPVARDAGDPSAQQQRMAQTIVNRMKNASVHTKCVLSAAGSGA